MALKNLLVHLDQSPRTRVRLELAVWLARKHQARLVGVFGQLAKPHQIGVVAVWPPSGYTAAAQASRESFGRATAGLAAAQWIDLNRGSDAEVDRLVIHHARHCDLVILGQHDDSGETHAPPDLVQEVLMHSGRPVLVVPYAGEFAAVGRQPLVGWIDSAESARALGDAMALIEDAQEVFVLTMAARQEEADAACADAALQLQAHGLTVRTEAFVLDEEEGIGVMDMLLNRATDRSTDLLVMGARAGDMVPFGSRGSGTRYILRHMTVPVLMSH